MDRPSSLISKLERVILPASALENPATAFQVRPLAIMSLVSTVMILFYAILWACLAPNQPERVLVTMLLVIPAALPLTLLRSNRPNAARAVLLIGLWLVVSISLFVAGGPRAPVYELYTLIVMVAALLYGWRAARIYAGMAITVGLILVLLDPDGRRFVPFATPMSAWLAHSAIMIVVSSAAYYILLRSQRALKQAQDALIARDLAQQSLRESEERFRLITSVTSDYTFSTKVEADGTLHHELLTGAFQEITGYTPEEFRKIGWHGAIHPDDIPLDNESMRDLLENKRVITEVRILQKSGAVRWVRVYALPVYDEKENRLVRINGGVRDITQRKLAETILREREERFKALVEYSSDITTVVDGDMVITFESQSAQRLLGYSPEMLVGKQLTDFIHPDDVEMVLDACKELSASYNNEGTREYRFRHLEGHWVSLETHAINRLDNPIIRGIVLNSRDVSERKQAEESIRRSEANLRALLDATSDVAFLMARDGTLLTINEALARPMGRRAEELIGRDGFAFLPTELRAQRHWYFDQVAQKRQPIQWEDHATSGWWANSVYPVESPTGDIEAFAVYSRDVTEQKRLEAEIQNYTNQLERLVDERTTDLRRAKDQVELILNSTADALAFAMPNGDVVLSNPAFLVMFNERAQRFIEGILGSMIDDRHTEAVCDALVRVVNHGERHQMEIRVLSEDGAERDVDLTFTPVPGVTLDTRHGILLNAHDITQFKEIERLKARFITDAVHDLATPISGLSTRLHLLRRTPDRLNDHVRALENQVQHLRNLLEDLRTLSRFDRGQMMLNLERTNINELAQRIFDTYEPVAINKQQTLRLLIDPAIPELLLDPQQIERVLVNLVSNAVNYTPEDRRILIETCCEASEVVIRVSDEGMGIRSEDLQHIFERFFRSDEARMNIATGTGLGLAITKEIVELHGGTVTVTSEYGKGSVFTVRLPR
ncbi:MAG: PAS domain S-box protein [Anaerolineae bacterium]